MSTITRHNEATIILGSRSPRRRELLQSVVGEHRLQVVPPKNSDEQGFEELGKLDAIAERLLSIVTDKSADVVTQTGPNSGFYVVTADTIVVATESDGTPVVLGQPDPDHWNSQVCDWMLRYYSGRTHEVWTGFQTTFRSETISRIVRTQVTFDKVTPQLAEWYAGTNESLGKAGGYAIQGAAATLVRSIDGSLTNVIGLPVLEVVEVLNSLGLNVPVLSASTEDSE